MRIDGAQARVCVTGGLGFIGAHLCRALADSGVSVRAIDRLSGRYAAGSGLAALPDLARRPNVSVLRADVGRDPLAAMLDGAHAVIHLAALPGVRAAHGLTELWAQNVDATARVAAEATARGQRFVLASTSSIYGNAASVPSGEASRPAPLNSYAASKLAAEGACLDLAARESADVVVARLFTVYGPGQRPDMAFTRWIDALRAARPVEWCAHPAAARDFTYVGDAVQGLIAALERGRAGHVYNLPGAGSTSLRQALRELERLTGRRAVIRQTPPSGSEAVITCGCGRKSARELGYRATVPLAQGLERQVSAARSLPEPADGRAARWARTARRGRTVAPAAS